MSAGVCRSPGSQEELPETRTRPRSLTTRADGLCLNLFRFRRITATPALPVLCRAQTTPAATPATGSRRTPPRAARSVNRAARMRFQRQVLLPAPHYAIVPCQTTA